MIFLGLLTNGANSWIRIGGVGIQPSEFAKIGMIIMLAKKLDEMEGKINNPKNLFTVNILCSSANDINYYSTGYGNDYGKFFYSTRNILLYRTRFTKL